MRARGYRVHRNSPPIYTDVKTYFVVIRYKSDMSGKETQPSSAHQVPTAPSYNDLFSQVAELQQRLSSMERSAASSPSGAATNIITTDYRVLPDLNQTVLPFTGHETSSAAEDWINTVDGLARLNEWPLNYCLQYMRSNLTGAARSWYISETFVSWEILLSKFRAAFVRTIRMTDRWQELNGRVQNAEEHIMDYFYDKLRMCRGLSLPFEEVRDHIILGIRSEEMSLYAMGRPHVNPSELLADLQDWERLYSLRLSRFKSTRMHTRGSLLRENRPPSTAVAGNSRSVVTKTDSAPMNRAGGTATTIRPPPRCYNCGIFGHLANACPKPRKPCSICSSTEHSRGRCPNDRSRRVTGEALQLGTVAVVRDNPFSKQVSLNGYVVSGLIDSGASCVLVRESAARNSGVLIHKNRCPLYTVGDVSRPSTSAIGGAVADIAIDGVMAADHEVLIVPDQTIPIDVLVGRTWLELPHISYHKQGTDFVLESNSCLDHTVLSDDRPIDEVKELYLAEYNEQSKRDPIVSSEVNIDKSVMVQDTDRLMVLINQFRDVFAKSVSELGRTKVLQMEITEVPGSVPVCMKPYRTSPTDRQKIARILQEWRAAGIISDSSSPYASPVLLINKASGEKRLCVDYRKLNQQTVEQPYPMPDIDGQLSSLAGGELFTTLDLSNGFLQIPLSSEAKEKSAFVTEDTTAKFERMPFGLKGAPGTFQKLMNLVFKELKAAGVVNIYLDDIIIPSKTWDDMLCVLKQVFEVLRSAGLTLKPSKCTFGAQQLEYLGFQISKGVIRPGKKVESIALFPRPQDAHELRRFLGLAGYFRRFMVGYAKVAAPLTALTGKNVPFVWDTKHQEAFDDLKSRLCSEPIVRMYDPAAPFTEVHTDASSIALSGILLQGPSRTDMHMIYAVSKKTTETESRYHSSRLELFAVIWTLNRLRPYLLGLKFTVVTDCQSLVYLNIHKTTKPQVARWFEVLQEFNFDIKYRPGTRMQHVDALSRVTSEQTERESVDTEIAQRLDVFVALSAADRIRFAQQVDERSKRIIELLQISPKKLTKHDAELIKCYEVNNGVLYKVVNKKSLLVVPRHMRKGIVIAAHDFGGHFAVDRTVTRITNDYWFPNMRRYVRQHINMCLECLTHKKPAGKKPGLLHPIPPGRRPFQIVHVDHLGPFETSTSKNRYLLVVADNLTKYIHLYPCRTTEAAGVVRLMAKFCGDRGIPDRIISDRGSCFTSRLFVEFCRNKGIKHTLNSSRHPQANGQVERANRTIVPILSMSTNDQNRWDTKVADVERMLNTAVNKTTSKTPYETLHGYQPRFHGGVLLEHSLTRNDWVEPTEQQRQARDNILTQQQQMKKLYDRRHYEGVTYQVGEVVVMLKPPTIGEPSKLQSKYRERPLQILRVLPGDTYHVAEITADGREVYATTAHVTQLKSWKILKEDEPEPYGEEDEFDPASEVSEAVTNGKDEGTPISGNSGSRPTRTKRAPARYNDFVMGEQ